MLERHLAAKGIESGKDFQKDFLPQVRLVLATGQMGADDAGHERMQSLHQCASGGFVALADTRELDARARPDLTLTEPSRWIP